MESEYPDTSLSGKVAVIAGDAYSIGRATVSLFIRAGAKVLWIDNKAGTKTDSHICIDGVDVPYIHADVTTAQQVKQAAFECEKIFPEMHVLFNVAGRATKQRFEETTEETWSEMFGRNITSAFLCSKFFLPLMKRAGAGSIINHGSIDSFLGNPSVAAYSAAKGGVIPLTHVMAHDLAKYGIRVNAISTGGIRAAGITSPVDQNRIAVTPARRMGTAADVANVALFLASGMSAYVNGANIVVDGGRTGITQGCYND